jgi:tRNA 5-methylaminomethyl-2-thiouridine biosynthesis bifunctional protein
MTEQLDSTHLLQYAQIDWQTDGTPVSQQYGDVYFSSADGLAESRHVFLEGNHLAQRWQELPKDAHFIIIESGFGTGLNFLAAWHLWRDTVGPTASLHYIAIEKHPLGVDELRRALSNWLELAPLADILLREYPDALPGMHQIQLDSRVSLSLGFGDILDVLDAIGDCDHPQLRSQLSIDADAWFLDGFAPAKNPAMWSPAVFAHIASLSKPGTSFATFTAAGEVKRGLQQVGFKVDKVRGFGRKRDMLRGSMASPATPPAARRGTSPAWHCASRPATTDKSAIVIGAGLAGCHTARALADSGWQVTILDQAPEHAAGASGNPAGILYTKLAAADSDQAEFSLGAYLFACRHYHAKFAQGELRDGLDGCLNGMLQLGFNPAQLKAIARIGERYQRFGHLVRPVSAAEAADLSGIPIAQPALFFPGSGWLKPRHICAQLLDHPAIEHTYNCHVSDLAPHASHWQIRSSNADQYSAAVCVIAAGIDSSSFNTLGELPLRKVGGQISLLPTANVGLKMSICHSGYVTPLADGGMCFGASFRINDGATDLRATDHAHNLEQLALHVPSLMSESARTQIDHHTLQGRAAVRCATPDYLPIVGPVPQFSAVRDTFRALADDAKALIEQPGQYWPGLYVNTGHGSRGLATTPIAAACIAAFANHTPRPLGWHVLRAVSPARFAIRAVIRSQH